MSSKNHTTPEQSAQNMYIPYMYFRAKQIKNTYMCHTYCMYYSLHNYIMPGFNQNKMFMIYTMYSLYFLSPKMLIVFNNFVFCLLLVKKRRNWHRHDYSEIDDGSKVKGQSKNDG